MITVEMHQANMKAALEECMKECGVSRYEAAYIMAFDFYECAGFDKELALRVKCNPSSFYNWLRGEFDFSDKTCSILEYEMREAIKEVRS